MKKKYIKPQCEHIFLAKGAGAEAQCSKGNVATGPTPLGCVDGKAALIDCTVGGDASYGYGCGSGSSANVCNVGKLATDPLSCILGDSPA